MTYKTKRASQGCNAKLAPTRGQIINKILGKAHRFQEVTMPISPWVTHRNNSIFGYEMSIVEDLSCHQYLYPNPLFSWLDANKLNNVLFDVLAKLCPLHPVVSYYGQPSLWLAPPPSGSGNTVGIIIGRDKSNRLRIIGTNFMNNPTRSFNRPSECVFESFDSLGGQVLAIYRLIENEIGARMTLDEVNISELIESEAYKYRTMAIYILVIDENKSYFGIETAVVTGDYPSDMTYEFAGELL